MIKVLELFSGIGAWTQALKELGIDTHIIRSEIDLKVDYLYRNLHLNNDNFPCFCMISNDLPCKGTLNLKDINKINWLKLKNEKINFDLIVASPPCQGYSNAKQNGNGSKDNQNNNLSLKVIKPIQLFKPKFFIIENVSNFLKSKEYEIIKKELKNYDFMELKINALNFIPQNRIRAFIVGIKIDLTNMWSNKIYNLKINLLKLQNKKFNDENDNLINYLIDKDLDHVYKPLPPNAKLRKNKNCWYWGNYIDNQVYINYTGTITATNNQPWILLDNNRIRKLTPKECMLLMGWSVNDYEKMIKEPILYNEQKEWKISNTFFKKAIGNSIVIPVIKEIFKILYN